MSSSGGVSSTDAGRTGLEGHPLWQLLFFGEPLTTVGEMWRVLVVWNMLGFGAVFLFCGLVAACAFRKHRLAVFLIPIVMAVAGSLFGFCGGALLSLAAAMLYISGPFAMPWWSAMSWGLGMPTVYVVFSLSKIFFP